MFLSILISVLLSVVIMYIITGIIIMTMSNDIYTKVDMKVGKGIKFVFIILWPVFMSTVISGYKDMICKDISKETYKDIMNKINRDTEIMRQNIPASDQLVGNEIDPDNFDIPKSINPIEIDPNNEDDTPIIENQESIDKDHPKSPWTNGNAGYVTRTESNTIPEDLSDQSAIVNQDALKQEIEEATVEDTELKEES